MKLQTYRGLSPGQKIIVNNGEMDQTEHIVESPAIQLQKFATTKPPTYSLGLARDFFLHADVSSHLGYQRMLCEIRISQQEKKLVRFTHTIASIERMIR